MIIDGASDKIQFLLGGTVATNQLDYVSSYSNYTASAVTVVRRDGTSNNVTAVDLVSSPAASEQNQLRDCSIYNTDTASATVKIQMYDGTNTRVIYQAILAVGDVLQYEFGRGWWTVSSLGQDLKNSVKVTGAALRVPEFQMQANITGANALFTGIGYFIYLGIAEKAFTTVTFAYRITTLETATIAYSELAVYKATNTAPANRVFPIGLARCGYTDCSAVWNSLGQKITAVTTTTINAGDRLYVVFGNSTSGTAPQLRTIGADDLSIGFQDQQSTGTQPSFTPFYDSTSVGPANFLIAWQGT